MTNNPPKAATSKLDWMMEFVVDKPLVHLPRILTHVQVRRPAKAQFVRVNPDPETIFRVGLLHDKPEGTVGEFLVMPALWEQLGDYSRICDLRMATTVGGELFLWPVPVPPAEARTEHPAHVTHRAAAERACEVWLSIRYKAGIYMTTEATEEVPPDPDWGERTFWELVKVAFPEDNRIADLNHFLARKLLGKGV